MSPKELPNAEAQSAEAQKPTLLIVENDLRFRETLCLEFRERGYEVTTAASLEEVKRLRDEFFRFATVDLRLDSELGLPIVDYLKSRYPQCRILILTGHASIATAVEAVKRGAAQYLSKPIQIDRLEQMLWTDFPLQETSMETESLARHEHEYIEWVLNQSKGNITEAARRLGIHRQSLQRKLRKFAPH
jgi:two-component system response regulator RegA